MAIGFHDRPEQSRASRYVAISLVFLSLPQFIGRAAAERSTFQTYGTEQGLASLDGRGLIEDRAGDIVISTEHGVFAYDGRRFFNLGMAQGLRDGGEIDAVAVSASGQVAVLYPDEVYVSEDLSDRSHPITALHFHAVAHPGMTFYGETPHRLVAWGDDFVLIAGNATVKITTSVSGSRVEAMNYDPEGRTALEGATAVFSVDGRLWETFDDNRICAAGPGHVRCYTSADGLSDGPWVDVVSRGGRGLARSATSVAMLDPAESRWMSVELPDQGGRYNAFKSNLGLYLTPAGQVMTQAVHGIDVLGPDGWRERTVSDGAPDGTFVDALTDRGGQLWFHMLGRGLVRWAGYGHWSTLEKSDGLSDGFPWETARSSDGSLWVTTDDGVDEVVPQGSSLGVLRVFPGSSYAIAATAAGSVWAGYEDNGLRIIDPGTGRQTIIHTPAAETIVTGPGNIVWVGTTKGLYEFDARSGHRQSPLLVYPSSAAIDSIVRDGFGGIYYLCGGRLFHRHRDGINVAVNGPWSTRKLEPLAMAIGDDRTLWIGGPGGLAHLVLVSDHVTSFTSISTAYTQTSTIYAVSVDHRGWVWVGTSAGVSVFDGRRWVSVDHHEGLLSNDVNEDGLREDPDGSVWISTTRGFSHLRDPSSIFTERPLDVVVTEARLGSQAVNGRKLSYAIDPLVVELGTPEQGVDRPISFIYSMSGVDSRWVTSSSGLIRYPFVPPGRHVLNVVAYDQLTHQVSQPATLVVNIAFPWWRSWCAEALCLASIALLGWLVMRLRYRTMYARQLELKRHVAEATEKLRYQATHDTLTGLLNRCEIERVLADKLTSSEAGKEFVVALIDIDHFKCINDKYGHLGGDDVLRSLGRVISRTLLDGEYAGRYGGEEILVVLADLDGRGAERVLDLHLAIRHDIFRVRRAAIQVTCSVGLAWAATGDGWESLIGRADQALYQAKQMGRDRVVEGSRPRRRALAGLDRLSGGLEKSV